jgi:hypothetical protein
MSRGFTLVEPWINRSRPSAFAQGDDWKRELEAQYMERQIRP